MLNWLKNLQETELSQFLQTSTWAFPMLETLHILSFGVLIGSAAVWDLRLLGLFSKIPLDSVKGPALTVARWAFGFAVITGLTLFISDPVELFQNFSFRIKMVLILLSLTNIAVYHLNHRRFESYERQGKFHALASLLLWMSIVTAGRWIAYI